jgi:hypothetical protein
MGNTIPVYVTGLPPVADFARCLEAAVAGKDLNLLRRDCEGGSTLRKSDGVLRSCLEKLATAQDLDEVLFGMRLAERVDAHDYYVVDKYVDVFMAAAIPAATTEAVAAALLAEAPSKWLADVAAHVLAGAPNVRLFTAIMPGRMTDSLVFYAVAHSRWDLLVALAETQPRPDMWNGNLWPTRLQEHLTLGETDRVRFVVKAWLEPRFELVPAMLPLADSTWEMVVMPLLATRSEEDFDLVAALLDAAAPSDSVFACVVLRAVLAGAPPHKVEALLDRPRALTQLKVWAGLAACSTVLVPDTERRTQMATFANNMLAEGLRTLGQHARVLLEGMADPLLRITVPPIVLRTTNGGCLRGDHPDTEWVEYGERSRLGRVATAFGYKCVMQKMIRPVMYTYGDDAIPDPNPKLDWVSSMLIATNTLTGFTFSGEIVAALATFAEPVLTEAALATLAMDQRLVLLQSVQKLGTPLAADRVRKQMGPLPGCFSAPTLPLMRV